jgi:phosphatidylinositol kinase/protein kinase (PI-3  family)
VPDTISLDALKKAFPTGQEWTLNDFYRRYFYDRFEEAQKNFVESLAGYSIFNFLLQVKDRHNANILIDRHGHLVHVDFGFFISNYPGGINFESAPFKLTPVCPCC